ncbi:acetyl-CoA carboxylase carboxyltransferase component [Sporomusaceae bacterium BoRhaA]|nr:acetyl-CoA carboxylase carboxyltransferase component [Pelorhabdus rhamnosifermentans]
MATVQEKLQDLKERREKVIAGGGQKAIDKQHAKGKLTSRERIDLLLDPGSFFSIPKFVQRCVTN